MKKIIFVAMALALSGCMTSEPTVIECKMEAKDCLCECKTSIDNPATISVTR